MAQTEDLYMVTFCNCNSFYPTSLILGIFDTLDLAQERIRIFIEYSEVDEWNNKYETLERPTEWTCVTNPKEDKTIEIWKGDVFRGHKDYYTVIELSIVKFKRNKNIALSASIQIN
jgi:hypothetical protein